MPNNVVLFYTDEKNKARHQITRSERLIYELVSLIKKNHFSEVKILAVNGYHYHRAIKESNCRIDKLTLLLRAPNMETMAYPTEENQKMEIIESTEQLIKEWEKLQTSGQISELCIEYYDFDTTLHFMILDQEILFLGLLYPEKEFPGSEVLPRFPNLKIWIRRQSRTGYFLTDDTIRRLCSYARRHGSDAIPAGTVWRLLSCQTGELHGAGPPYSSPCRGAPGASRGRRRASRRGLDLLISILSTIKRAPTFE